MAFVIHAISRHVTPGGLGFGRPEFKHTKCPHTDPIKSP